MSMRAIVAGACAHGSTLTFLGPGGRNADRRTWAALHEAAARRATALVAAGVRPGDRVVLIDDTGPAIVEGFLAAQHAGAIPIVLAPPIPRRGAAQVRFIAGVVEQTEARAVLVGEALLDALAEDLGPLAGVATPLPAQAPNLPPAQAAPECPTAFLQFSSGSTRTPRGVIVPQRNVAANLTAIAARVPLEPGEVQVSWLPLYHDMGLIAGVFGPPAWAAHGVLMDPMTFVHRPAVWLRAISDHRAASSVAPNFAYEMCLRRIRDQELEGVRLDTWRIGWNGAESIQPSTVRRFEARFAGHGLRPHMMLPCYGAAEGTLMITARPSGTPLRTERLSRAALERGEAVTPLPGEPWVEVTSCGPPADQTRVRVLDEDGGELPERRVGELEIRSPAVCPGYWGGDDPALDGDRFLSGDLGFLADGELYVTGRKKELIIVGGRNLYPVDLEAAAFEVGGPALRRAAAFSLPDVDAGTERIVVALELERPHVLEPETRSRVTAAVSAAAGWSAVTIVALDAVPVTTSGKIQRVRARHTFERARGSHPLPGAEVSL